MKTFSEAGAFVTQQTFTEPVEVTAQGVTFSECRFTSDGYWEQAMLATGPGTRVLGCELLGDRERGHRRGIMVNSPNVVIERLTAFHMFHTDDAWCIAGWDGTAHLEVRDCQLEASGETIIFGGATTSAPERVPQDILIENCTLVKPSYWRTQPACTVKNLLEIKCGKRIRVQNVRMFGSWPDGQAGFAILCTVRNQDNDSPWVVIEDVTFRGIMAREIACGVQIDGHDANPTEGLRRLTIEDSRFELNAPDGRLIQLGGGAEAVTIQRTEWRATNNNSFLTFHDAPLAGFVMRESTLAEGWYGARGDDRAPGTDSINFYAPDAVFEQVQLWGQPGVYYTYPAGIAVDRTGAQYRVGHARAAG